jgi:uncharacterized RDD family membrane protein YckC
VSLLELAESRRVRSIVTPEGVALPFELASVGDRAVAFLIDIVVIFLGAGVLMLAGLIAGLGGGGTALALAIVASFLLRNFYFAWMELRYGGRTLGKRKMGLRVIARDGGPLTAEAVLARNLTRDLEVFLPLTALTNPAWILPGAPAWGALLCCLWLLILMLLPLFNRDRMRCGDIIAGTLVVRAHEPKLLSDLTTELSPIRDDQDSAFPFTAAQLDHYGIRELQVLEDVLRDGLDPSKQELLVKVAGRIREKIGWTPSDQEDDYLFLMAFYKAQRARLEHRLLLGERRERKRGRRGRYGEPAE